MGLLGAVTVKAVPPLVSPATVTTTLPVVAAGGTGTAMVVALQLMGLANIPLKVTVLVPCVAPKFVPVMLASRPTGPEAGERLAMLGGGDNVTVNVDPILATPPTVTTTFPVVAADGTGATMVVALQLVGVALVPLNITVLVPCVAPKLLPVMVTLVPTAPEAGERLVMLGGGSVTVNVDPLLATPPTVTTTFPVVADDGTGTTMLVALQLVGVALVPLNITVLVPCVAPKLLPAMVTLVPTAPDAGERLVTLGGGSVTVNGHGLLATPPTVTTTFPVVAPLGTGTVMLVELQLVGVVLVPFNLTVLVPTVAPKLLPVMVRLVPTPPEAGDTPVMTGGSVIV